MAALARGFLLRTLFVCSAVFALSALRAACPQGVEAALRAEDQSLLDAYAPGDRARWDRVLTPKAVVVDENGTLMTRADFLKTLTPLPANTSGSISIIDYQVHVDGDTALVVHRDDERENYHGILLRAQYLMTETWLCRAGSWKLSLAHVYVQAKDPPTFTLASAKLREYAGRYQAAPDLIWTIREEGGHLMGQREGGAPAPLLAEAPDVLFVPGQPRDRRIFQRDAAGVISGYIQRREGEDIFWKRIP